MADFHFLRPLWLLLLLALPLLPFVLRHARHGDSGWGRIIPATLLAPLISQDGTATSKPRSPLPLVMIALAVLAIALAGPAWRQAPTPLAQQDDSLVIVLDLSLSMLANDVQPDRLTLAKRKIRDLLQERQSSLTALVVFAGDAHVVAPLTDDRHTIEGMLDVLEPVIMPATGNRADLGIARALRLLEQGAPDQGRVLLIGDDVSERYHDTIRNQFRDSRFTLSTLTVGTEEGGPIPLAKRGFIRDNGNIVMARANPGAMARLAEQTGGRGQRLTLDDDDIRSLRLRSQDSDYWQDTERDLSVNRWQDDGYWLLWLAAPLLILGWRRGAMVALLLVVLPLSPRPALAADLTERWSDFWVKPEQRGAELIHQDPASAARRLESPEWRGSALYRAEDYEAAARAFAEAGTPQAHYNRGNALARAGKLEDAIAAYDAALASAPDHEDARHNRDLVQQLLNQQEQQQQSGDNSQDNQENNDQNRDQQDQSGDSDSNSQGSGDPSDDASEGQSEDQQQDRQQNQQSGQQQDKNPSQPDTSDDTANQAQGDSQGEPRDGDQQQQASTPAELDTSPLTQGQEQWLRRVPDNPGGLLRRKFLQQHQIRDTQPDEGDTPW